MSFEPLGLSPETLRAIGDAGYTTPTPIQEKAIPWVLMGRDVLGCAQTGTGKTASFTLPMIDILASGRAKARMPRSLILEPTRELAAQVAENFDIYGKYHPLSKALLIGGVSFDDQEKLLDRGVDVLIATPGRLLDHFERGRILMSDVKLLVIDEADRMLDMGFIPDVERIVSLIPPLRQTLFFSATMPPEIRKLADKFLSNPKEIMVTRPATAATTVTQGLLVVPAEDKRDALRRMIAASDVKNALIFCNRKRDVDILYKSLKKHGFNVGSLHGDMSQPARTETLERFKAGQIQMLVCSDVAARGIDIDDLSHVFNFDMPFHAEDYVHRIGRTGRAGKTGVAYSLAAPDDGKFVAAVEHMLGKEIPRLSLDGFAAPALEEDDGRRRGRGRGGRDGRGGGGRNGRSEGGRGDGGRRERGPRREPRYDAPADRPSDLHVAEQPALAAAPELGHDAVLPTDGNISAHDAPIVSEAHEGAPPEQAADGERRGGRRRGRRGGRGRDRDQTDDRPPPVEAAVGDAEDFAAAPPREPQPEQQAAAHERRAPDDRPRRERRDEPRGERRDGRRGEHRGERRAEPRAEHRGERRGERQHGRDDRREGRRDERREGLHGGHGRDERSADRSHERRPERGDRGHDRPRRRDRDDLGPPVQGLGDHVPAFLRQEPRRKPPRRPAHD